MALPKGLVLRARQMRAMLRKGWLFSIRSWKTTLLQLMAPLIFTLLLITMDLLPKNPDSNPYNPFPEMLDQEVLGIGKVPRCTAFNDVACKSIRYVIAPEANYTTATNLIELVRIDNGFEPDDIFEVDTEANLNDFILEHANATQLGLVIYQAEIEERSFSYNILFNASYNVLDVLDIRRKPDGRNELQISVDKAILQLVSGRSVSIEVYSKQFPQLGYDEGAQSAAEAYGTAFFYCGIMFQFVILLYNICQEKDLYLRRGLATINLKASVYWLSWLVIAMVICIIATLVQIAAGFATQLTYFTNTDFIVSFIVFFLYSLSLVTMAMFCSVFISKAKSSLNMGMGIFVLGMLFVAVVGNEFTVQAIYDDELTPPAVHISFEFLPPFNLAKIMADINAAASDSDTSGATKEPTPYTWDSLYDPQCIPKYNETSHEYYCKFMPPTYVSLWYLVMNFAIFGILTWYFDNVLPSTHGEPRPLYFFLQPSYYGITTRGGKGCLPSGASSKKAAGTTRLMLNSDDDADDEDADATEEERLLMHSSKADREASASLYDDEDVRKEYHGVLRSERAAALKGNSSSSDDAAPIRIAGLGVTFNSYSLKSLMRCKPQSSNRAVQNLYLEARQSEVLSLLGHNGAGKSTTIGMLTGMLRMDAGDARICGHSLREDPDGVRSVIGVCPQHDILWGDLTAREHMEIFCEIRCIPRDEIQAVIKERLDDVQLYEVADHRVETYSGGMKRRLSVALSFIGNPKAVFLDEPTTGMDPYIRRDVWNLILRLKKDRVIIMTTHSMEEADVLGDKIAVMAHGQLRCVGSSVHLKNRFAGYKINLVVSRQHLVAVKSLISTSIAGVFARESVSDDVAHLTYELLPCADADIVAFLERIEGEKERIPDFSITQTSLEEVFLKVTADHVATE